MNRKLIEFVEKIARQKTHNEREGGLQWSSAVWIVDKWITEARNLTGANPDDDVSCGTTEQTKPETTICPRCGAIIADQEAHRAWHRGWNDWELEDLATTLPAPYSSQN